MAFTETRAHNTCQYLVKPKNSFPKDTLIPISLYKRPFVMVFKVEVVLSITTVVSKLII